MITLSNKVPTQPEETPPNQPIGLTVQIVIDTLSARIKSGGYQVDTRLPSERALANELGVSRNTVREALDYLTGKNFITRRPGSGSFVTYRSQAEQTSTGGKLAEQTGPLDHLVMRGILEPEIVRLAVMNMTQIELETLSGLVTELEKIRSDVSAFMQLEEQIYLCIAKSTRNPLLAASYQMVVEVSREGFRKAHLRRHLTPERILDYQQRYNKLCNAFISRDIETAVEFVKLQLVEEQKLLIKDL